MYKSLYDIFQHWYRGGQIYLYSDPHFSDPEMPNIRANYVDDEEQIRRINSKVGKNDTIIILGDIGNIEYVKRIRGYKILIMGNHDSGASLYKRKITMQRCGERLLPVDNRLFDEVYEGALIIGEKLILSHEPIDYSFAINIHGHDHSGKTCYENSVNVCAEHIDYTPVALQTIINSGRLKAIRTIHRATIDAATSRAQARNT